MLNSATSWSFLAPILVWAVVGSGVVTVNRPQRQIKEQMNSTKEQEKLVD